MDPSSIIAQVERDGTGNTTSSNVPIERKHRRKRGNLKSSLALLRDRLFCCLRSNVSSNAENAVVEDGQIYATNNDDSNRGMISSTSVATTVASSRRRPQPQPIFRPAAESTGSSSEAGKAMTSGSSSLPKHRSTASDVSTRASQERSTTVGVYLPATTPDNSPAWMNSAPSSNRPSSSMQRSAFYELRSATLPASPPGGAVTVITSDDSASGRGGVFRSTKATTVTTVIQPNSGRQISAVNSLSGQNYYLTSPGRYMPSSATTYTGTGSPSGSTMLETSLTPSYSPPLRHPHEPDKPPSIFSPPPPPSLSVVQHHSRHHQQQQPQDGRDAGVIVSSPATPVPLPAALPQETPTPSRSVPLLPPPHPDDTARPCLIIDLDETLVHSSFKPISNADFVVPVEIDGTVYQVYVSKRPYVDEFLQRISHLFECVLFTASLAKYADPVANLLDRRSVFRARLFREACIFYRGNYVKDLSLLGRNVDRVAIVDNSPASYMLHPENAIAVTSWFDDPTDRQLLDVASLLEDVAHRMSSSIYPIPVRAVLRELTSTMAAGNMTSTDAMAGGHVGGSGSVNLFSPSSGHVVVDRGGGNGKHGSNSITMRMQQGSSPSSSSYSSQGASTAASANNNVTTSQGNVFLR